MTTAACRIGAGVNDARSSREITIDPCGDGPTHTLHRAELAAIHSALQRCAGNEAVRILTDSQASMDGIRNYIQSFYTCRLTNIANPSGRNKLRTTIGKVATHTGIEGNEPADAVAERAAAPTWRWITTSRLAPHHLMAHFVSRPVTVLWRHRTRRQQRGESP